MKNISILNIKFITTIFFIAALLTSTTNNVSAQQPNKRYLSYIDKYKDEAIRQQKKHKIPASITLAQGLLESGAGYSELALKSNNHFGIKCHEAWKGKKVYHNDDKRGECFRKYDDPFESYEDHSLFLTSRSRYAELFNLKITDYKKWAVGLKRCGYATDKTYASKLIGIIELYDLDKYDRMALEKERDKNEAELIPHTPYKSYGLLYIEARDGDTFKSIGKEFDIKRRKLASYNELPKDVILKKGMIVYLQEKNKYSQREYKTHIVKVGESLHSIAQKYGMKLFSIYKLNKKENDYIPQEGDTLKLNKKRR